MTNIAGEVERIRGKGGRAGALGHGRSCRERQKSTAIEVKSTSTGQMEWRSSTCVDA